MTRKAAARAFIPYLWMYICLFYLLPLPSVLDTHSANSTLLTYALFIVNPVIVFLGYFMFGLKAGFHWWAPLVTGILFFPTVYIYYNQTALVYTLIYLGLAWVGIICGNSTRKNAN